MDVSVCVCVSVCDCVFVWGLCACVCEEINVRDIYTAHDSMSCAIALERMNVHRASQVLCTAKTLIRDATRQEKPGVFACALFIEPVVFWCPGPGLCVRVCACSQDGNYARQHPTKKW